MGWSCCGRDIFRHSRAAVALAIMMIPTITRTTEEMLLLVPHTVREAAMAWDSALAHHAIDHVADRHLRRHHRRMLAFARVAGETAPLLFTAFGNQFWNWRSNQPTAALAAANFHLRDFAL